MTQKYPVEFTLVFPNIFYMYQQHSITFPLSVGVLHPSQTDQISFNFMGFSKEKIVKNIELAALSPVGVYTPLVENIGCTPVFDGSHSPIG